MVYITLFFIALISGSLFPLGSEGVLIYDLKLGYNPYSLVVFASVGNTIGALINYYLGLKGEEYLEKKGYLNAKTMQLAKKRFKKFGAYALLLSPLPIIGDPITFIAGVLKYNIKKFIVVVLIAKSLRYIFIAQLINF
jgi:membrane protein YqaA with SNARE-associated domain